jgi:hypothetical protein
MSRIVIVILIYHRYKPIKIRTNSTLQLYALTVVMRKRSSAQTEIIYSLLSRFRETHGSIPKRVSVFNTDRFRRSVESGCLQRKDSSPDARNLYS